MHQPNRERIVERFAVAVVVGAAAAVALAGRTWPFDSRPRTIDLIQAPSIWQYLLADRATLGFARLGIVFGTLFLVASVVALSLGGRWMSRIGSLSVDVKETGEEKISHLERQLRATELRLHEETTKRHEAEDWADGLMDRLDETELELDRANEEFDLARGGER